MCSAGAVLEGDLRSEGRNILCWYTNCMLHPILWQHGEPRSIQFLKKFESRSGAGAALSEEEWRRTSGLCHKREKNALDLVSPEFVQIALRSRCLQVENHSSAR